MKSKKFVEKEIEIKGIHCSSCVKNIERSVSSLDGVKKIKVSLEDEKAWVQFDPKKTSLNEIKKMINKLGYRTDLKINGKENIKQGILYGMLPHIGCIAFVLASILGASFFTQLFRPILMSKYFFYILIAVSAVFATISSYFYLKRNGMLSNNGIKRSWKYLATMYGTTIGVNVLFFLFIFPILTNVSAQNSIKTYEAASLGSTLKISVDIPCSGHAPLITDELKKLQGINNVKFDFPNIFTISYDSTKITKDEILSLDVFKIFPAKVLNEDPQDQTITANNNITTGVCGINGSCGCGIRR
jgi:copper ion binding protein